MSGPTEKAPLLEVADRSGLRAWLQANHSSSQGIRLAIGKKGNAVTRLTYEDAIEEALCFGWIDSRSGRLDESRYTVTFTPRRPGGTWARSNKDRVARLTEAGLMTPAGLAAVEAAKADGTWNVLDDVEDLRIPSDLASALDADPDAAREFERLPVSKRKQVLGWIGVAKRAETRERRVSQTVRALREGRAPV